MIENLNAGYWKFQVLFNINLKIPEKKIIALVGPNGSGKSTLLKSILGLTDIYSGKIYFNGRDITKLRPDQITRLGIVYLPQVGNTFTNLTVKENLQMAGYILKKEGVNKRMKELMDIFPILRKYKAKKVRFLSGGERQMLAMAMALLKRPKIMLFDEPITNLAPKIASEIYSKIKELRDKYGITVVLADQAIKKALKIAEQSILLICGEVAYEGSSYNLLNHPELGKVFLGIK
jgi:branched-chain amino acid transport system ATP-binding protein